MISQLLTRSVTIARRSPSGSTDDYGNVNPTIATSVTVGELQQVQRRTTGETVDDLSDTLWLLVLPAGTSIDTSDKVTVGGESFEVSGAPWTVRHPRTGVDHHVEVNLRRVAAATDS